MKALVTGTLGALLLAMGTAAALAQIGPGMGAAMGGGMGPGGGWRVTQGNTPGYALMTSTERSAHQAKIRDLRTYEECRTYMGEHHRMMEARAQEKGTKLMAMRADPCADLRAAGRIK
ncbi:MAG: hypothetical protein WBP72_08735 [Rhodocyclaceae bacterium]